MSSPSPTGGRWCIPSAIAPREWLYGCYQYKNALYVNKVIHWRYM